MLTIGEVAARAGVNPSHIRYYEDVGVLPEPERVSGQRRYDEAILQRLSVIARAEAVRRWLELARECTCPTVDVCGLFSDPALIPPRA